MSLPNIIIIVVDSLRYDYSKILRDKLEKYDFISYKNVIAPSSWTIPTHASILTGLYPLFHNAHETRSRKMKDVYLRKNDNISGVTKEN